MAIALKILFGLGVLGGLVAAGGGILLLVAAFRVSAPWGLVSLFVPFGSVVFTVKYWASARRGFLISLAGTAISILCAALISARMLWAAGGDTGVSGSVASSDAGSWAGSGDSGAGGAGTGGTVEAVAAVDPLVGLSPIEVRRAIGNPTRGEGTRGGRTIWFYDDKDVVFEHGHVTRVVVLF